MKLESSINNLFTLETNIPPIILVIEIDLIIIETLEEKFMKELSLEKVELMIEIENPPLASIL